MRKIENLKYSILKIEKIGENGSKVTLRPRKRYGLFSPKKQRENPAYHTTMLLKKHHALVGLTVQ
jgi:hypothetical protein